MTRITALLTTLSVGFIVCINAFGQVEFAAEEKSLISDIKKKMENADLTKMTEAENTFEEAKFIMENAIAEDVNLEKAFAKGSTPKAEKKAVNVKRNRIEAAKLYEKAYNLMFDACDARLGRQKFYDPEEKTKAKELRNQAGEKITAATTKGDDYKFLEDVDLETYKYDEIKASIDAALALFKEGISLELEAWKIQLNQMAVEPAPQAKATEPAQPEQTTPSPEKETQPQENTPQETALVESSQKEQETIVQPEPQTQTQTQTQQEPKQQTAPKPQPPAQSVEKPQPSAPQPKATYTKQGVNYRVQVAAIQSGQLPDYKKKELYSGNRTMHEEYENGMYKYRIGDFSTFSEAKGFIDEYGKDAFVVKYINGVKQ